jgi:hypothetical protein
MELLKLLAGFSILLLALIAKDWLLYKGRGRVQPDNPNEPDGPIITGPGDAINQRIIDGINRPKNKSDRDRK